MSNSTAAKKVEEAAAKVPPNGIPAPTAAAPAAEAKKADVIVLPVNKTLEMPEGRAKRGSKPKYDFGSLEVKQSIGVKGRNAKSLGSTISAAIRAFAEPKRDANNALVYKKDKDGNATNEVEMVQTRHFFAADCDPKTDPEGADCRIWRDK